MSRPRKAIALLIRNRNLPAGSWQVDLHFSDGATRLVPGLIHGRDAPG
jgi:hypothetical protein